jgi:hypothetical protein
VGRFGEKVPEVAVKSDTRVAKTKLKGSGYVKESGVAEERGEVSERGSE